ncbi:MAG: histidine kinase [Pseudomonadota bacterium]
MSATPLSRGVLIAVGTFWMAVGGLYLLSVILNAQKFDQPFEVTFRIFLGNQGIYLCWAAFNILMISVLRRVSRDGGWAQLAVLVGTVGLVWLPVNLWLDGTIADWTFQRDSRSALELFAQTNFFSVFFVVMLYLLVVFASLGWTYIERWQAAREAALRLEGERVSDQLELADLRMQLLRSQLSPHFLFNALGSISGLIRTASSAEANTAIQNLGDMLRFSLATSDEPLILLEDELTFCNRYLALQKLRFGGRFESIIDAGDIPPGTTCPPFVLQTLLENAFVHGVETRQEPSIINTRIRVNDTAVFLEVSNPVAATSVKNGAGLGIALTNLRHRLRLLFSEESTVSAEVADGRFEATVTLPRSISDDP